MFCYVLLIMKLRTFLVFLFLLIKGGLFVKSILFKLAPVLT